MTAENDSTAKGTFPGSVNGTYLDVQVMPFLMANTFDLFPELRYSVLYLLASGSFAWFNYWSGFVYGREAGRFTRDGASLHLQGQASLFCDTPDKNYSYKGVQRQIALHQSEGKRVIRGLNLTEHLFIGSRIYIPLDGLQSHLFPRDWNELQGWIDGFLKSGKGTLRLVKD